MHVMSAVDVYIFENIIMTDMMTVIICYIIAVFLVKLSIYIKKEVL